MRRQQPLPAASSSRASTSSPATTTSSFPTESASRSNMAAFVPLPNSISSSSPVLSAPRHNASSASSARSAASPAWSVARSSPSSSWMASLSKLLSVAAIGTVFLGAQGVIAGAANNVTSLQGTWSTGAGHVTTGLAFYNPVNLTFNWPTTGGRSYSFTDDGFYEESLYLYESTPAKPSCVAAQLIWQHGTYVLNANNSLSLTPFSADGRQSIADRCASTSTNNSYYYQEEYMAGFTIELSEHYGSSAYVLQLYAYDGSLLPLMWQTYNPPAMLPTESLHEIIYGETA